MKVICSKHGLQFCVEMTRKLLSSITAKNAPVPYIEIKTSIGESQGVLLADVEFAKMLNYSGEVIELDMQEWIHDISGMCKSCFQEIYGNALTHQ